MKERQPISMIATSFGDFDGRERVPAGYIHLPAENCSKLDMALGKAATFLGSPFLRYVGKMYRTPYWHKDHYGIVVPEEHAVEVAEMAELLVAGHVELKENVFGRKEIVNHNPRILKIEWV